MDTSVNNIPQKLIQAIQNNRLVLFAGAGFSKNINENLPQGKQLPDWNEFIFRIFEELAKQENISNYDEKYYNEKLESLKAGQGNEGIGLSEPEKTILKKNYGSILSDVLKEDRHIIYEFIYDKFRLSTGNSSKVHELALNLTRMIITTNYDNAFETTYEKIFKGSRPMTIIGPLAKNRTLLFKLRENLSKNDNGEFIFKIHGCASAPDSCVIFTEQYEKLYYSMPKGDDYDFYLTRKSLEKILEEMTILFVGVSFEDDYMRNLFGCICGDDRYHHRHYVITNKKDENKFKEIPYLNCIIVDDYKESLIEKFSELNRYKESYNQSTDRLRQLLLFRGLSNKTLQTFIKKEKTIEKNHHLAEYDKKADSFFVILKGSVVAMNKNGEICASRSKDEIIGEFAFSVSKKRIRSIICQENDTHVIEIDRETIEKISPEDQNVLWQNIVYMILKKENELNRVNIDIKSSKQQDESIDWKEAAKSLSEKFRTDFID